MNWRLIYLMMILTVLLGILGCAPSREDDQLSPIIYVSGTAQERFARQLIGNGLAQIKMVNQVQRGFALPAPARDNRYTPADSDYYVRTLGDTLAEMIRFSPNVWSSASGQHLNSLMYRWELYGGDTATHGTYSFRYTMTRSAPESLATLTGESQFTLRFISQAGDGYYYNYPLRLFGTYTQQGGTPPPLAGNRFDWNGYGVTWESDGIPSRWNVTGNATSDAVGSWNFTFKMDNDEFVRAAIDSMGVGTFRIGWDNFARVYTYLP